MVEGLIGKKIGMTQIFNDKGNVIPVTVIEAGPCTVIQMKTFEKDGYSAVQMGLVEDKEQKSNKPMAGHLKKAGVNAAKIIREFHFDEGSDVKEGSQFFADIFNEGDKVSVVGISKGKGFAGVIKRWGFHGGKKTHGSMFHRRPGSTGASAYPSHVFKGKKLPGHLGDDRVTVRNLKVIQVEKDKNLLVISGAVPGASGGYVLIKKVDFNSVPEKTKKE
jgi:large subunit ribosomal protein L3